MDRFGPKRVWALSVWGRVLSFAALPFVDSFSSYLLVGLLFALAGSAGHSSYQAYVLDALPAQERVETQAYLYSALNVGFTLGAILGGVALAFDNLTVIRWTPWFAAVLAAVNAWWIGRLPQAPHDLRVASGEVNRAATIVISTVIPATNSDGMPNRTTCDKASTSLVVRATRSPVPARSTVDSGKLTARPTNCSRSWAKTVSPRMNDIRRAPQVSAVWTTTAAARPIAMRSTVPRSP